MSSAGDIVREAVAALREARERPDVVVDAHQWVRLSRSGGPCYACLAGAWVLQRRGWRTEHDLHPLSPFLTGEEDDVLNGLDSVRAGNFYTAATYLGADKETIGPPPKLSREDRVVLEELLPGAEEILLRVADWMDGGGSMSELQYTCVRCEGDYLPLVDGTGLCTRCVKARFRELESRPTYDPETQIVVSKEDARLLWQGANAWAIGGTVPTYDPATEVVVSREALEVMVVLIAGMSAGVGGKSDSAIAEARRALAREEADRED